MNHANFRSGIVTLLGRPNVGKSSLLNYLVGTKISITSRRPQTTRHRILGIKTRENTQIVYVDTPGVPNATGTTMQRYLNRIATGSVEGVDVIVLVMSAEGWCPDDERVLALIRQQSTPIILVVNKIDKLKDRAQALPIIEQSTARANFSEIVPVSARTGDNITELERVLLKYLPEQPLIYPPEQITDKNEAFHVAEIVREQIFNNFGQEVPYATTVQVESLKRSKGGVHVDVIIWVEKEGQKAILIGKKGVRLKYIGTHARLAMQKLFATKVHLGMWVKVRDGWASDAQALRSLGYGDENE